MSAVRHSYTASCAVLANFLIKPHDVVLRSTGFRSVRDKCQAHTCHSSQAPLMRRSPSCMHFLSPPKVVHSVMPASLCRTILMATWDPRDMSTPCQVALGHRQYKILHYLWELCITIDRPWSRADQLGYPEMDCCRACNKAELERGGTALRTRSRRRLASDRATGS